MKISTEFKIGITGIIISAVIIWGINYLKGQNILSSNNKFYALYSQVNGLEPSANVMLNGFKIGVVNDIVFDTESQPPFTVIMEVAKQYKLRNGSVAEIISADLLGSKAINILQGSSPEAAVSGDTLKSSIAEDLISSIAAEIRPLSGKTGNAISTIDSVAIAINMLLRGPEIEKTVANLSEISTFLGSQFTEEGNLGKTISNLKAVSDSINRKSASINATITNLEKFSNQLQTTAIDSLIDELGAVTRNLNIITKSLTGTEGSAGKLINDDSLYNQINILVTDLDSLINDINSNPKKYVQFSLF